MTIVTTNRTLSPPPSAEVPIDVGSVDVPDRCRQLPDDLSWDELAVPLLALEEPLAMILKQCASLKPSTGERQAVHLLGPLLADTAEMLLPKHAEQTTCCSSQPRPVCIPYGCASCAVLTEQGIILTFREPSSDLSQASHEPLWKWRASGRPMLVVNGTDPCDPDGGVRASGTGLCSGRQAVIACGDSPDEIVGRPGRLLARACGIIDASYLTRV